MAEYGEPVVMRVGERKVMLLPVVYAKLLGSKWLVKGFVEVYIEAWREPEPHVYMRVWRVEEREVEVGELGSAVEVVMAVTSAKARELAEALKRDAAHVRDIEIAGTAVYFCSLPAEIRELWSKN